MIELPNSLKSVRHCKLPESQTSGHSSSSQYWLHIYEAKITSIEDRLKSYLKPPLLGFEPPTPLIK